MGRVVCGPLLHVYGGRGLRGLFETGSLMEPAGIWARGGFWLFAFWGLAAGSFANVLIFRLPAGFRLTLPRRSVCTGCFRQLRWHENIPVLSYVLLRGRCGGCRAPIGLRHPVVEVLVAALFIAVQARWGFSVESAGRAFFAMLLVAACFIDLEHRIIPDEISLGGLFLGLLLGFFDHEVTLLPRVIGAAAGAGGFWLMAWLYAKATGRDGLGFGDVKLLGMIGAFLGPLGVFGTVLVSSVVGATVGLALIFSRRGGLRTAVPYGPFLVLGALLMLFWGDGLVGWLYPDLTYGSDVRSHQSWGRAAGSHAPPSRLRRRGGERHAFLLSPCEGLSGALDGTLRHSSHC